MATPVIKVAAPGYDIRTASPRNLRIDSTKNQFKVLEKDTVTFDLNAGNSYTYERTISHSLSFSPTVIAFVSAINQSTKTVWASKYNSLPSFDTTNVSGERPLTGVVVPSSGQILIRIKEPSSFGSTTPYTLEDVVLTYIIFADKNFDI